MKKNLLPSMQHITMKDQQGKDFTMAIELRRSSNPNDASTYVFVSDTSQLGASRIAQDAVYYFETLCQRFNLKSNSTVFFRHIYQEHMGSLFGRFKVNWDAKPEPSYRFQMLTNIDDLQSVTRLLASSSKINIEEYEMAGQAKRASA